MLDTTIVTRDLVTIGWGYPSTPIADIHLMRHKPSMESPPAIPGSTIKGVLRTASIRAAKLLKIDNICVDIDPRLISSICRENDIVLEIYGRPGGKRSRLMVETFRINRGSNIDTVVLKHVSIDRDSLKNLRGALYSVEYLPPCTEIKGKIALDIAGKENGEAARMLDLILLSLIEIQYIGIGRGSKRVWVKIDRIDPQLEELKEKGIASNIALKLAEALLNREIKCVDQG